MLILLILSKKVPPKAAKFRFLGAAKFLWEVLALEARHKVKWSGIAGHGVIIQESLFFTPSACNLKIKT